MLGPPGPHRAHSLPYQHRRQPEDAGGMVMADPLP